MEDLESIENLTVDEEKQQMKKRGNKRLFIAFLIADIFLAIYIIYSLILLFINL